MAPIVGIAVSLWRIAFPAAADIDFVAECQQQKIYVTAINRGGQVGAIIQPSLYKISDGKKELSDVSLIPKNGMSQILKPGDGVVIEYDPNLYGSTTNIDFPGKDNSKTCELEIDYPVLNFDKVDEGDKFKKATCSCWEDKS